MWNVKGYTDNLIKGEVNFFDYLSMIEKSSVLKDFINETYLTVRDSTYYSFYVDNGGIVTDYYFSTYIIDNPLKEKEIIHSLSLLMDISMKIYH